MRTVFGIVCFFITTFALAQPPQMELSRSGFPKVDVSIPATKNEKLIELSKSWALETYKRGGYDVTDVTENSMTISAIEKRAFYYRNKGEGYDHDINFDMKLTFYGNRYSVQLFVKQIFADGVKIEYTIPDYFTSDGSLKEGYADVKPSLEATANTILKSYYNYITNFR